MTANLTSAQSKPSDASTSPQAPAEVQQTPSSPAPGRRAAALVALGTLTIAGLLAGFDSPREAWASSPFVAATDDTQPEPVSRAPGHLLRLAGLNTEELACLGLDKGTIGAALSRCLGRPEFADDLPIAIDRAIAAEAELRELQRQLRTEPTNTELLQAISAAARTRAETRTDEHLARQAARLAVADELGIDPQHAQRVLANANDPTASLPPRFRLAARSPREARLIHDALVARREARAAGQPVPSPHREILQALAQRLAEPETDTLARARRLDEALRNLNRQ